MSDSPARPSGAPAKGKTPRLPPQKAVGDFWAEFSIEQPERVTRILPPTAHAKLLQREISKGPTRGNVKTSAGYEAASDECKRKVKHVANECRRRNEKWSDPEFNLETDKNNCLQGLVDTNSGGPNVDMHDLRHALRIINSAPNLLNPIGQISLPALGNVLEAKLPEESTYPQSVHRVDYIFEKPQFTIDGFGTSDVLQGQLGDCWWVASAAALCNVEGHMDKVCVARDEECGVYGFVFFRDGEWISTIVDDNLCLTNLDFDAYNCSTYDPSGKKAKKWKEHNQTGSEALFHASCEDSNETWLPLLEKAYAKIHGDYAAIEYGWAGEGVEDLSGGIATTINLNKILSKERLWEELLRANKDFIFTISTPGAPGGDTNERNGLTSQHAYTVLQAVEHEDENGKNIRFVRIRNPWGVRDDRGKGEWDGPWSDGSKEWTQYWIQKLEHQFGDDGVFYITFEDMLMRFDLLDRVRLFNGDDWYNSQLWTSVNVPWVATYLDVKFVVDVKEPGVVVFALSQLDDRYYQGLEGQYTYYLHFLLRESESDDHIALADTEVGSRSISAEVELSPGKYELIPKIVAHRHTNDSLVEEVVKKAAKSKPLKLQQVGLNYDKAHLKASQWELDSETASQDKKPTIPEKPKAPEQITKFEVVVKQESSLPLSEGGGATKGSGLDTAQPQTAKEDGAKKEQPSVLTAVAPGTIEQERRQSDVNAAPGGEDGKDPDPVEQKAKVSDEDSDDEDDDETSPWNAVCVIGLRVFSKDANLGLHLEES